MRNQNYMGETLCLFIYHDDDALKLLLNPQLPLENTKTPIYYLFQFEPYFHG